MEPLKLMPNTTDTPQKHKLLSDPVFYVLMVAAFITGLATGGFSWTGIAIVALLNVLYWWTVSLRGYRMNGEPKAKA